MPRFAVVDQVKSALRLLEIDPVEIRVLIEIDERASVSDICCMRPPAIVDSDQVSVMGISVQLLVFVPQ